MHTAPFSYFLSQQSCEAGGAEGMRDWLKVTQWYFVAQQNFPLLVQQFNHYITPALISLFTVVSSPIIHLIHITREKNWLENLKTPELTLKCVNSGETVQFLQLKNRNNI